MVHQQLVEEGQNAALVGPGHIGVVFGKQMQIGTNAVEVSLAAGGLQKLFKGGVHRDGVHQRHVVGEGQVAQGVYRLGAGQQGGVLLFGNGGEGGLVGVDAPDVQKTLKVPQLGINNLIAAALLVGDVVQLGQNHVVGIVQRVNAHDLASIFPDAAHPKVGVNQQEGFQGEVFKLQIPGGMVGGAVGNVGAVVVGEPLPGIVVVQIGDAGGVPAAAAKFSNVMAERGGRHQGHVHRQPCGGGLTGGVQRDVVNADGMRGRVKGLELPPNAHQGDKMALCDRPAETRVFRSHPAGLQFLFRQGGNIGQRIVGTALLLAGEQGFQQGQIKTHRLGLRRGIGWAVRVGKQAGGNTVIKEG